ncbi:hypothetical protein [Corallibacter sp.]|uniref:hypothetical protein n=1 Tax=Corallibacter sp. TaxID=2038084 RepID=UPI003AB5E403
MSPYYLIDSLVSSVTNLNTYIMKTFLSILSVALLLVGAYFIYTLNGKYKECQDNLIVCKSVPNFIPSLVNVTEYVGARKRFHFKTKCYNDVDFDFSNKDQCEFLIREDISNENFVTLVQEPYKGTMSNSSYIADWIEDWNFYVDLSNTNNWDIQNENNVITFKSPKINVARLSRTGNNNILVYITDRATWSNDSKALLNMYSNTNVFASVEAKNYLKEHYDDIKIEMEKSIKRFINNIITKQGLEKYEVKVIFESL